MPEAMRNVWRVLRAHERVAAVTLAACVLAAAVPELRASALGALAAVALLQVPRPARRGRPRDIVEDVERGTASELRSLDPSGWVWASSGSFEHLVVGPSGAYLLDTKRFAGEAMVREGVLGVRRDDTWRSDETLAGRVRGSARDARRLLGAANINWVAPVVVLWCEFPAQVAEHGGVTYVHGSQLAAWLRAQPESVSAQSVENARSCLRRLEADALRDAA